MRCAAAGGPTGQWDNLANGSMLNSIPDTRYCTVACTVGALASPILCILEHPTSEMQPWPHTDGLSATKLCGLPRRQAGAIHAEFRVFVLHLKRDDITRLVSNIRIFVVL